jgi:hypothetical protein
MAGVSVRIGSGAEWREGKFETRKWKIEILKRAALSLVCLLKCSASTREQFETAPKTGRKLVFSLVDLIGGIRLICFC